MIGASRGKHLFGIIGMRGRRERFPHSSNMRRRAEGGRGRRRRLDQF